MNDYMLPLRHVVVLYAYIDMFRSIMIVADAAK